MLRTLVSIGLLMTAAAAVLSAQPASPAAGTATIRGHVFAGDTGLPLRRAQVRIIATDIRENRMTATDANGAYEFTEVRAGRYMITASKGSYVSLSYGQQRTTDSPKPIEIRDRQTVERLDLSLPRGAVITGRIVDEFGELISEVDVALNRYQFNQGRRTLVPAGSVASTNDIGEFRLFGVPPGQYYVSATWRNSAAMNPTGSPRERIAYAPTYFPGTTNAAGAQRIAVAAGQELRDIVMMLKTLRAARVTGIATGFDGKPLVPAVIVITQPTGFPTSLSGAPVRPDGTFTINGLAPGEMDRHVPVSRDSAPGSGRSVQDFRSATRRLFHHRR